MGREHYPKFANYASGTGENLKAYISQITKLIFAMPQFQLWSMIVNIIILNRIVMPKNVHVGIWGINNVIIKNKTT